MAPARFDDDLQPQVPAPDFVENGLEIFGLRGRSLVGVGDAQSAADVDVIDVDTCNRCCKTFTSVSYARS